MIMKHISLLIGSFFLFFISYGQQKFDNNSNRVNTLKIAFITEKLSLTETEAQKFWPIYKQYDNELKNLRANNEDAKADVLANEEKALSIRKKYQTEFKRAISDEKINQFFQAEKEFNNRVKMELRKRIDNRQDRPTPREQKTIQKKN